jgi:hypothetical protein
MPASGNPAWGRAAMAPDRWRGTVGVKADPQGAHQELVATTGTAGKEP